MRSSVVVLTVLAVLGSSPDVGANESLSVVREILRDGGDYHFELNPTYRTDIFLPEEIIHVSAGNMKQYQVGVIDDDPTMMGLQPIPFAGETNVNLKTKSARISMRFTVTTSRPLAKRIIIFEWPKQQKPITAPKCTIQALTSPNPTLTETKSALQSSKPATQRHVALLHKLFEEKLHASRTMRWRNGIHRLIARIGNIDSGERYLSLKAVIRNTGDYPFPIKQLEFLDRRQVDGHIDHYIANTQDGKLPEMLQPGEDLMLVVSATAASRLQRGWVMKLVSSPAVGAAEFRWDDEPSLPRPYKKLTVGLEGRFGTARFVRDGISEFTTVRSADVRARYGVFKYFALEGVLGYIDTGDATFDSDTTSMTGAKMLANGVLTMGDQYVPFVRIGAGLIPSSVTKAGKKEFDLFPVFAMGIGFDAWLSRSLLIGSSLQAAGGSGDVPLTVDFSLHLSYAWNFLDLWQ